MRYAWPAVTRNVTRLSRPHVSSGSSSLAASLVRPVTTDPVYTPMVVSKLLPQVSKEAEPEAGATHENQTELIGVDAAMFAGSPDSPVAPTLVPTSAPSGSSRMSAEPKLSLPGASPDGALPSRRRPAPN